MRLVAQAPRFGIGKSYGLIDPMIEAAKKDIKEGKLRTLEDVKKIFGPGNKGGQQ